MHLVHNAGIRKKNARIRFAQVRVYKKQSQKCIIFKKQVRFISHSQKSKLDVPNQETIPQTMVPGTRFLPSFVSTIFNNIFSRLHGKEYSVNRTTHTHIHTTQIKKEGLQRYSLFLTSSAWKRHTWFLLTFCWQDLATGPPPRKRAGKWSPWLDNHVSTTPLWHGRVPWVGWHQPSLP